MTNAYKSDRNELHNLWTCLKIPKCLHVQKWQTVTDMTAETMNTCLCINMTKVVGWEHYDLELKEQSQVAT